MKRPEDIIHKSVLRYLKNRNTDKLPTLVLPAELNGELTDFMAPIDPFSGSYINYNFKKMDYVSTNPASQSGSYNKIKFKA